jgi:hypothetical protein
MTSDNGPPISLSAILGLALTIEWRSLAMSYIDTKKRLILAAMFALCTAASAGDKPPAYIIEPAFALRLDANVKLDPMPEEARAKCERIADDENATVKLWVFAKAADAGATYYVTSGYVQRRHSAPGRPKYEAIERGGIYIISGNKCIDDPADETFHAGATDDVPLPILQRLSQDLAARLVRAVGSAAKLRAEIKNQRIDFDTLSPELQEAFKPYFSAATK